MTTTPIQTLRFGTSSFLKTFAILFVALLGADASADCGCTSDCGGRLDLRRVQGTVWMDFMASVKSCNGASPISAYRSTHCQQQLYTCIKRRGCGTLVGRPGSSPHETGIALDYRNAGNIRSCMERARRQHIPGSSFGRPHPGQHIDNGGRNTRAPAARGNNQAAPRPAPREEPVPQPRPRPRAPAVTDYQQQRRTPARQQRIQQVRQRDLSPEQDWAHWLWSTTTGG